MGVRIFPRSKSFNIYDDALYFTIKTVENKPVRYLAQNAFGVKRIVTRFSGNQYIIFVLNADVLRSYPDSENIIIEKTKTFGSFNNILIGLDVPRSFAKSIKENLEVIFWGNLSYPLDKLKGERLKAENDKLAKIAEKKLLTDYYHNKPEIDYPYEFYLKENYIPIMLLGIFVYNKKTGEIITKINFEKRTE
jgi:hypothetical protein